MAKQIKDTLVRKYNLKGAFFDGNSLLVSGEKKDDEPTEVDLLKDLHDFFLDNEFDITVQMKSENEVEEPDEEVDIEDLQPDEE